ncbi:mechanosensitive ion channel family protein [Halobacteriaceae archaeon SHR40]|uniref:mechanosensitive ion channel family protein n=1 Tax=Halovenus amylolytica TaxID=2500550 RepID=UPI000FE3BDC9
MSGLPAEVVLQSTDELGPLFPDLAARLWRGALFFGSFLIVLLVGWYLFEPALSRLVEKRNPDNPTVQEAITRYTRLVVTLLALFAGFGVAGFTRVVGGSALVVAAGTLALGVAGQSVIGSLVSGLALVADPQFNVGDYICWDGGEGEVTSITLRVTRVRTVDGGLVTIPNTTLTSEVITRPFEEGPSRVTEQIAIAYEEDVDGAIRYLAEAARETEGILDDPGPNTGIEELGSGAVTLYAEYWIARPRDRMRPVRAAYARRAKELLENGGVELSPASEHDLEGRLQVENITP